MKKIFYGFIATVLCLLLFVNETTFAHHKTVNWDGMELKKGQIGVGLILKTTKIYNYIDGELVLKNKAKAKEKYRVFKINEKTNTYSIGSKQYIKINDENVKYTEVPESKIKQLNTVHQFAVRGTYWGDSLSDVKKVENSNLIAKDKDTLLYRAKKFGYPAKIYYNFNKNKLESVFISLVLDNNEKYLTWNEMGTLHNRIYNKLKTELKTKKGTYFTNEVDSIYGRVDLKTRSVSLVVSDKNIETTVNIFYSPVNN